MSFLPTPNQNAPLNVVNATHQQITAKLGAINTLKAQKKASTHETEQTALQTLIDLRVAEVPDLISKYVSAVTIVTSSS
jgi:hypothetical protein